MSEGYKEKKGAVQVFLKELKQILTSKQFQHSRDFYFIKERYNKQEEEFSTEYTLTKLDYDTQDVINELLSLKIENYVETLDDKKNNKSNKLYVFAKDINNRQIYIKIKISSYTDKKVTCISFHFSKYIITKFIYK